ncbi:DUF1846 domain-containing protein [bacterium]|nr:DUF1846 domain-containing protein [bacterium]
MKKKLSFLFLPYNTIMDTQKQGFDTNKYLEAQKKKLTERLDQYDKLYLEFGGKLINDRHAVRVLPGYRPDTKLQLLKELGDLEIIYCISAQDIEKGKIRGDTGLAYDDQAIKEIDSLRNYGMGIKNVVITRYTDEQRVEIFKSRLEKMGIVTFLHNVIPEYSTNMESVLLNLPKQSKIETKKKLVVVTGPGGGSGKMGVCLSQIYHEYRGGVEVGYTKFETFPIWNLSLNHPINLAYEAATADIGDINMIDPFHKEAYNILAVNYDRDIVNFRILRSILKRISGGNVINYKSPTDMGVNMAATGIVDDSVCREAAKQEIIRRYFRYLSEYANGTEAVETVKRMNQILLKGGIEIENVEK